MFQDMPVISTDAHLEVTPDTWLKFVDDEYKDYNPRHIKLADGTDGFLVEGRPIYRGGMNMFAGSPPETFNPQGLNWDAPGSLGPVERIKELDKDGVEAEVIFPGVGGRAMWGGIQNPHAYHNIVSAYNRYIAEEFNAVNPSRLLAIGVIPDRGIEGALTELDRIVKLGLRSINISRWPSGHSYPTPEDDAFWARVVELNMPISIHVTTDLDKGPIIEHSRVPDRFEFVADPTDRLYRYGIRGATNAIQFIMSGVLDRFPALRVYFAENQVGWVPLFMEQADHNYKRHHFWAERLYGWPTLERLPSEYVKEFFLWGFFNDQLGVRIRHEIGVDHIMWGSDFPHVESDWPNSLELLAHHFEGVPKEDVYAMIAGNAIEFFHLDEYK